MNSLVAVLLRAFFFPLLFDVTIMAEHRARERATALSQSSESPLPEFLMRRVARRCAAVLSNPRTPPSPCLVFAGLLALSSPSFFLFFFFSPFPHINLDNLPNFRRSTTSVRHRRESREEESFRIWFVLLREGGKMFMFCFCFCFYYSCWKKWTLFWIRLLTLNLNACTHHRVTDWCFMQYSSMLVS